MNLPSSFDQAEIVDQDVTVPAAQHPAAFLALKALWDEERASLPQSDDPMDVTRALLALMAQHGWSSSLSLTGNLVGLYHDGTAPHHPVPAADAEQVFTALAPFVEDGCFQSYQDPAPSTKAWSVVFADGSWSVESDNGAPLAQASAATHAHA